MFVPHTCHDCHTSGQEDLCVPSRQLMFPVPLLIQRHSEGLSCWSHTCTCYTCHTGHLCHTFCREMLTGNCHTSLSHMLATSLGREMLTGNCHTSLSHMLATSLGREMLTGNCHTSLSRLSHLLQGDVDRAAALGRAQACGHHLSGRCECDWLAPDVTPQHAVQGTASLCAAKCRQLEKPGQSTQSCLPDIIPCSEYHLSQPADLLLSRD
jgi:hypothetical protein